jgi:hypothetical protein
MCLWSYGVYGWIKQTGLQGTLEKYRRAGMSKWATPRLKFCAVQTPAREIAK